MGVAQAQGSGSEIFFAAFRLVGWESRYRSSSIQASSGGTSADESSKAERREFEAVAISQLIGKKEKSPDGDKRDEPLSKRKAKKLAHASKAEGLDKSQRVCKYGDDGCRAFLASGTPARLQEKKIKITRKE